jgi:flagellar hook-basal body complex protein FliE
MNVLNIMSAQSMTRTNPAHSGTAPLTDLTPGKKTEYSSNSRKTGTFESFLLEAVNGVNDRQLEVSEVQNKLITDPDSVDIHDVTTAMAKAQMSLNLAQTVIDRLTTAWNEIQTTR